MKEEQVRSGNQEETETETESEDGDEKTFEQDLYSLQWFEAGQVPQMNNPAPLLQQLLHCGPKFRALLRNVRSQVCNFLL